MSETSLTPTVVDLRPEGGGNVLRIHIHGERDRHVSQQLRETGVWEPFETKLLLATLPPGGTFLDVGANIGYFTLLAAQRVGAGGTVIAVEPDPDNCRLLRQSLILNGLESSVQLIEGALADADGQGSLYLSEDNLGDHQIYASEQTRNSVPIDLHQGSDLLVGRLAAIDLVKIDTQGSEYQVVAGLVPLLQQLPTVPLIMIELTPFSLSEAGASGRQLIELLATVCDSMWIVDHVEHQLVSCPSADLATWCDNVAATPGDRGFMNILVGPKAPQGVPVS